MVERRTSPEALEFLKGGEEGKEKEGKEEGEGKEEEGNKKQKREHHISKPSCD